MIRSIAALALLGAALVLPQAAAAQSAMCAEQSFAAQVERAEQAPAPLGDDDADLPWCASAEDPRCAPLHGDSTPLGMGLRQPLAFDADAPEPHFDSSRDDAFTPHTGPVPCAGETDRLERPPR